MSDQEDHVDVVLEEPKASKDDVQVEVVDDKAVEKPDEAAPDITPDEGIKELRQRLEAEKRARAEAEKMAQKASEQAKKAKVETSDANYQLVVNAIETVKGRAKALEAAYVEAMNVGDHSKAAEIQSAIATNANQLSDLKKGKKAMKDQLKQAKKAEKQPIVPVSPPQGDLVDQLAAAVSPKSAQWLQSHRNEIRDERMVRRMFRAHEDAVDDGIAPDSDEYFSYVEQRMGLTRAESTHHEATGGSPLSSASAPRRTPQPPPAPVSRSNQRPNVVRLTREQAEHARMFGMTDSEYAKNFVALQREGKIGN